jgi:DNA-binding response OmpR family regulator
MTEQFAERQAMAGTPRKILVVDDDLDIRLLLKAILTEQGYEVTAIGNGMEAFQDMVLRPPDLVILDLMMPIMGGVDFAVRLANSKIERPPVLVISGFGGAEETARSLGASRVLKKPFELQALLDNVEALVGYS